MCLLLGDRQKDVIVAGDKDEQCVNSNETELRQARERRFLITSSHEWERKCGKFVLRLHWPQCLTLPYHAEICRKRMACSCKSRLMIVCMAVVETVTFPLHPPLEKKADVSRATRKALEMGQNDFGPESAFRKTHQHKVSALPVSPFLAQPTRAARPHLCPLAHHPHSDNEKSS